jgi:hypothetical protein
MFPFTSLTDVLGQGFRIGQNLANNLFTGQPLTKNLGTILSNPTSPIIINNPAPKQSLVGSVFGGDFKIGFVEKNVIILGALAIGGLIIWKKVK